jgi:hypothetical protein
MDDDGADLHLCTAQLGRVDRQNGS